MYAAYADLVQVAYTWRCLTACCLDGIQNAGQAETLNKSESELEARKLLANAGTAQPKRSKASSM
ncbi:hypothetical protein TGAM01_v207082 [Trichoderma gamsii]|uniref:Uncharacterized protein n=1 Tax=Trichoderma gamsii TaxID=398673 RepID=A0A2P4ZIF9_9HYPO|nr:hypothetical protein TGAM01_v207082 [Trichoderma gamsii]PON24071.1 hypothetical protein TGAM01_v207082 [Trichoderma gamsii]